MYWPLDLTMIILAGTQFQRQFMLVKLMLKKQLNWLALKPGIIKMIMKDYKNSAVKSSLTAWDYIGAVCFILTMLLLIIGV